MAKSALWGSVSILFVLLLGLTAALAASSLVQPSAIAIAQSLSPFPLPSQTTTHPSTPTKAPTPSLRATQQPTTTLIPGNTTQPIVVKTEGSDWTIIASVVALCVSIASFVVSLLVYLRDRSNLIISGVNFSKGHGMEFLVWVVNEGRRPVLIEEVLLRSSSGEPLYIHARGTQPKFLGGDGERERFELRVFDWAGKLNSPLDIVQAEVCDTTRKKVVYKFSDDFKEEIRQKWTPELAESFARRQ
jgi:hypothetical protein